MIYIVTTERKVKRKFAVEAKSSKQAVEFVLDNLGSADFFLETKVPEEAIDVRPVEDDAILDVIAEEMGITDSEDDEYWTDEVLETYINIADEE